MTAVDTAFLDTLAVGITEFFSQKPFDSAADFEEAHDEYQDLLETAKSRGLYEIGEGRDRITFEVRSGSVAPNDCVVKLSKTDGTNQNREAIEIWEEMDDDARECVAPLVDWDTGYRWIVQRQASHTAYGSQEVIQRLEDAGWGCSDIRTENVGDHDGKPVLVDLGVGLRPL